MARPMRRRRNGRSVARALRISLSRWETRERRRRVRSTMPRDMVLASVRRRLTVGSHMTRRIVDYGSAAPLLMRTVARGRQTSTFVNSCLEKRRTKRLASVLGVNCQPAQCRLLACHLNEKGS